MHMLTEMIDFTASGIKKGSRVRKFVLEKSMTIEREGRQGRSLEPTRTYKW